MKNNFFLLIAILIITTLTSLKSSHSNELIFKALKIETFEEGNIIIGTGKAETKTEDGIEIYANKFKYKKNEGLLIALGNVRVLDTLNKINLNSEIIHYYENSQKIISYGATNIDIKSKYFVRTSDLNYEFIKKNLSSQYLTKINDNFNNKIKLEKFKYNFFNEIITGENIQLLDNEDNEYFLDVGLIELKKNIMLGKDININFSSKGFEVPEGEPRLKGNSITYDKENTVIKKGIFTSCKKNDKCPPWLITSKEITHNKKKKTNFI